MYKRSYLYARVSTLTQDTYSQKPALLAWAKANDPLAGYVEDYGTGRNMRRQGIQTITAGIRSGETQRVVVVSINRLGRSVKQVCEFLDLCLEHDVQLISLREGMDISTPMGRMLAKLLACVAELENEQRSEATLAGLDARFPRDPETGKRVNFGGSKKGYSLKVTAEKAAAILALHAKGASYCKIAKAVGLSDKTVREVVLNPRQRYVTRSEAAGTKGRRPRK